MSFLAEHIPLRHQLDKNIFFALWLLHPLFLCVYLFLKGQMIGKIPVPVGKARGTGGGIAGGSAVALTGVAGRPTCCELYSEAQQYLFINTRRVQLMWCMLHILA